MTYDIDIPENLIVESKIADEQIMTDFANEWFHPIMIEQYAKMTSASYEDLKALIEVFPEDIQERFDAGVDVHQEMQEYAKTSLATILILRNFLYQLHELCSESSEK